VEVEESGNREGAVLEEKLTVLKVKKSGLLKSEQMAARIYNKQNGGIESGIRSGTWKLRPEGETEKAPKAQVPLI